MSRLLEEFNVKVKNHDYQLNDYLIFKDKDMLDEFRIKILEDLSDKGFLNDYVSIDLIDGEIDKITHGYDLSIEERGYLFNLVDGEINGIGPITYLLKDDIVSEIMINSPSDIYVEVDGVLKKDCSVSFINNDHIIRTVERLIKGTDKVLDKNNPILDARLEDGSRINVVIPPLSKNPVVTIRKFKKNITDMDTLIGNGSLTPYMARFLEASVRAKLNILVCGGSASGRTTLLNVLGNYIPNNERIIIIEEVGEIDLNKEHVISLETNSHDNFEVRDLISNSYRMRADRLIVDELRGREAFDMLQAMNTGYEGSITSVYASNTKNALSKIETMLLMNVNELSKSMISEYINEAIDLVVHISKTKDGRKKIDDISEVILESGKLQLQNIFEFKTNGFSDNGNVKGEFILQEYIPNVLDKIKKSGIDSLDDIFEFKPGKAKK